MSQKYRILAGAVALVALVGCVEDTGSGSAGRPSVGSSTDLSAFEGARAGQAEMGIRNLGYELIRSDGLHTHTLSTHTH